MSKKAQKEIIEGLTKCELAFDESDPNQLYYTYNNCEGLDEFRRNFNRHYTKVFDNLEVFAKDQQFVNALKRFLDLKDWIESGDGFLESFSHKTLKYFNLASQKEIPPFQKLQLNKLAEPFIKYQWQEIQSLLETIEKYNADHQYPSSSEYAEPLHSNRSPIIEFQLKKDIKVSEFMTALAFYY